MNMYLYLYPTTTTITIQNIYSTRKSILVFHCTQCGHVFSQAPFNLLSFTMIYSIFFLNFISLQPHRMVLFNYASFTLIMSLRFIYDVAQRQILSNKYFMMFHFYNKMIYRQVLNLVQNKINFYNQISYESQHVNIQTYLIP